MTRRLLRPVWQLMAGVEGAAGVIVLPAIALAILAVALLVLASRLALAHELMLGDGRTVDYTGIRSPKGSDCCGNRDCAPVEWREVADGRLEVLLPQFGWVLVPTDVMMPPHPDAPDLMHVCWRRNSQTIKIWCVMPPGFGA